MSRREEITKVCNIPGGALMPEIRKQTCIPKSSLCTMVNQLVRRGFLRKSGPIGEQRYEAVQSEDGGALYCEKKHKEVKPKREVGISLKAAKALISEAGKDGADSQHLIDRMGFSIRGVQKVVEKLRAAGDCFTVYYHKTARHFCCAEFADSFMASERIASSEARKKYFQDKHAEKKAKKARDTDKYKALPARSKKQEPVKFSDVPAVETERTKRTICPPALHFDPRYQVDPATVRGPFTLAGIGRSVETGRAWGA